MYMHIQYTFENNFTIKSKPMTWTRYMICSRDSGEDKGGDYTRVMGEKPTRKASRSIVTETFKRSMNNYIH